MGFRTVRLVAPPELAPLDARRREADWPTSWITIGEEDELGDPIVCDTGAPPLPVLASVSGEGAWEPLPIADSIDGFLRALDVVEALAQGREHPVALESNPLSEIEERRALGALRLANPLAPMEFWRSWLIAYANPA